MSVVNITIANQKYKMGCENGQEARLLELGKTLDSRSSEILDKIGPMPENMLLVTLCVVLADELGHNTNDAEMQEILARVREIKRNIS